MDRRPERKMGYVPVCGLILLVFLSGCMGPSVPDWVNWTEKTERIPDNPGLFEGTLELKNRCLKYHTDNTSWQSDGEWLVSDFLIDDIDVDGWPEVLMNAWVKGQYGDQHPIWEKPQESEYTQRLFVFHIREKYLEPQWMSSEMKPQYTAWSIDNHQLYLTYLDGMVSVWVWEGRGFVRTEN